MYLEVVEHALQFKAEVTEAKGGEVTVLVLGSDNTGIETLLSTNKPHSTDPTLPSAERVRAKS